MADDEPSFLSAGDPGGHVLVGGEQTDGHLGLVDKHDRAGDGRRGNRRAGCSSRQLTRNVRRLVVHELASYPRSRERHESSMRSDRQTVATRGNGFRLLGS